MAAIKVMPVVMVCFDIQTMVLSSSKILPTRSHNYFPLLQNHRSITTSPKIAKHAHAMKLLSATFLLLSSSVVSAALRGAGLEREQDKQESIGNSIDVSFESSHILVLIF
jgi:hypothetical protein